MAPYLENQPDPEIWARYEIVGTDVVSRMGKPVRKWALQNRFVVNALYDDNFMIDSGGWESGRTVRDTAYPDFRIQTKRAYDAYSAANPGTPPAAAGAILPYFNPPLDPAVAEKLRRSEVNKAP